MSFLSIMFLLNGSHHFHHDAQLNSIGTPCIILIINTMMNNILMIK